MAKKSAGLLMYRRRSQSLEVLLVHPGGPFWKNKDAGAWGIPKGEVNPDEPLLEAAQREFFEETAVAPSGPYLPLGSVRLSGGKRVHAWAFEGGCDPAGIRSNTFQAEWPPRSGILQTFPEVDQARFFEVSAASRALHPGQVALLERLLRKLGERRA